MSRITIISPSNETADIITQAARLSGCDMICAESGSEMRRLMQHGSWSELAVINAPLPDEFGWELAEVLIGRAADEIVFLCPADTADDMEDRLSDYGITVIAKPVAPDTLARCFRELSGELGDIRESSEILSRIDDIRLINKAKAVLMKYLRFTEPQAHRYLEKQAMNNRCTRRQAAIRIIETYK